MFPNLQAEIHRQGTERAFANKLGWKPGKLSNLLAKKKKITMDEMFFIKETLGVDISLDDLFLWVEDDEID